MPSKLARRIAEDIISEVVKGNIGITVPAAKENMESIIDRHLGKEKSCEHEYGDNWKRESRTSPYFESCAKALNPTCPFCPKKEGKTTPEERAYLATINAPPIKLPKKEALINSSCDCGAQYKKEEPMSKDSGKEWCAHIKSSGNYNQATWRYANPNKFDLDKAPFEAFLDWNFCPICGTPRPAPQEKKLLEVVRDSWEKYFPSNSAWTPKAEANIISDADKFKAHIISQIPSVSEMYQTWNRADIEAVRELIIKAIEGA